ncbi:MAG TPA: methyltransferase domain-containing protein [Solirubrobacter sp.]|nr:methyltransferase domain-containing protein [Solirubrobacter sp.]
MSDRRLPGADLRTLLRPALSTGSSAQVLAEDLVPALLAPRPGATVVDLGCGRGDSVDVFRAADPGVRWIGVEVPGSEFETRPDVELRLFDGLRLPFEDGSVDVVFCKQVLEHVERLDLLVADVARVLRPDGVFAGSTSHLEPYHGRSTANVTPYGMLRLLDRCGLELEAIMPGIDGPTLIARRLLRGAQCFDRYWARRSPFNTLVDGVARVTGWDAEDRTALKLLFGGQYAFVARPRGRG